MDYALTVSANPFGNSAEVIALQQAVDALLHDLVSGAVSAEQARSAHDSSRSPQTEDMLEDLFDELEMENSFDADFEEFFEELFTGPSDAEQLQEARAAEEQSLNELMKASSINRLFRKVARVLHPDRERDDAARAEKNRLMSLLLQARDSNDIPLMFALYTEHVGESPLHELANDLKGVTQLLHRQYERLRWQREEIIDEEPVAAALYGRFYQKSAPAVQRDIAQHVRMLKRDTQELQRLQAELDTVSKLKRHLATQRQEYDLDDLFDLRL
jgi:hypothetical protein